MALRPTGTLRPWARTVFNVKMINKRKQMTLLLNMTQRTLKRVMKDGIDLTGGRGRVSLWLFSSFLHCATTWAGRLGVMTGHQSRVYPRPSSSHHCGCFKQKTTTSSSIISERIITLIPLSWLFATSYILMLSAKLHNKSPPECVF